ncbi:MAG: hypothetical protein ACJ789_10190 [Thermomicrobiales bacterium]
MALSTRDLPLGSSAFGSVYLPVPESPDASFIPVFTAADLARYGIIQGFSESYMTSRPFVLISILLFAFTSEDRASQSSVLLRAPSSDMVNDTAHGSRPLEDISDQPGIISVDWYPSEDVTQATLTFRVANIDAVFQVLWSAPSNFSQPELTDLARILEHRMNRELKGEPIPGVDYDLPGKMLNFGAKTFPEAEGYLSKADIFFMPWASNFWNSTFVSAYRSSSTTDHGKEGLSMPQLTVLVLQFTSDESAEQVAGVVALKLDRPFDVEEIDIDQMAGSSWTRAYQYADEVGGSVDSFDIVSSTGSYVVLVEVQEAITLQAAKSKALQLMRHQLGWLNAVGPCSDVIELQST